MGIHSFLADEYEQNILILEDCKKCIGDAEGNNAMLPSARPGVVAQFPSDCNIQVMGVNHVVGNVLQILKNIAYTVTASSIRDSDSKNAKRLGDPISDIVSFTTILNNMTNTMSGANNNGLCPDFSSCSSSLNSGVIESIAKIKFKDYARYDYRTERYEYNNEKVDQLFDSMKSGKITLEQYRIIEEILLTCVSGKDGKLNTDELQYIMNSSRRMTIISQQEGSINVNGKDESAIYVQYNADKYSAFWKEISKDISGLNRVTFAANSELLSDVHNVETTAYQTVVNLNSMSDVIAAFCEYTDDIIKSDVTYAQNSGKLAKLKEGLSQFSGMEIAAGFLSRYYNQYKDYKSQMDAIEKYNLKIVLDCNSLDGNESKSLGDYYNLSFDSGKSTKAYIFEYSCKTNDTLGRGGKEIKIDKLNEQIESYKYDLTDYKDANDYAKKNSTSSDFVKFGYETLEAIPGVGDVVALIDDVANGVTTIAEAGETDDATSGIIKSGSAIVSDEVGYAATSKSTKKGAKSIAKLVTVEAEIYQYYENLKDEYYHKVQHNYDVVELLNKVNSYNYYKNINETAADNEYYNEKGDVVEKQHFSFTVHTDNQYSNNGLVISDNRITKH